MALPGARRPHLARVQVHGLERRTEVEFDAIGVPARDAMRRQSPDALQGNHSQPWTSTRHRAQLLNHASASKARRNQQVLADVTGSQHASLGNAECSPAPQLRGASRPSKWLWAVGLGRQRGWKTWPAPLPKQRASQAQCNWPTYEPPKWLWLSGPCAGMQEDNMPLHEHRKS